MDPALRCPDTGRVVVQRQMLITLTPEQEAWLKAYVANGDFASIEEAARQLIDERIAERAAEETDDLAWPSPMLTKPAKLLRAVSLSLSMSTRPVTWRFLPRSNLDGAAHRLLTRSVLYCSRGRVLRRAARPTA
jgi:antitoxin ParD1/3/4